MVITNAIQAGFLDLFHVYIDTDNNSRGKNNQYGERALHGAVVFVDMNGNIVTNISSKVYSACAPMMVNDRQWDQTFHKSWEKVEFASYEELVFEQLVHYMSTYGRELLGLKATPILPAEPIVQSLGVSTNLKAFTIIQLVSADCAKAMIEDYLKHTLAPNKRKIGIITEAMRITDIDANKIASFELQVIQHDRMDTIPSDPTTFLRYMLYKISGSTLLIKNRKTINTFKTAAYAGNLHKYVSRMDAKEMATIFYRFKPFFLALKADKRDAAMVNTISRLARVYHKPMDDRTVQNFSKFIRTGQDDIATGIANRATGRQLIKLFNYFSFQISTDEMTEENAGNIYNIRNGRAFLDTEFNRMNMVQRAHGLTILRRAIMKKYKGVLAGKTFVVPEYIRYAAPITEKQFIGNIPYGTAIAAPSTDAFTAAIAWDNYKGIRTDIDLHLTGANKSYGWNSGYRSDDHNVIYSGDMTDATHGAAEAYYFAPKDEDRFILSVNLFSGDPQAEFKMFLSEKPVVARGYQTYTKPIDTTDALFAPIPLNFADGRDITLGLFVGSRFYFYGGELGHGIVPDRKLYARALEATTQKLISSLAINSLINAAGGTIITPEQAKSYSDEEQAQFIDLSPSALTARSLLDIVDAPDLTKFDIR